MYMYIHAHTHIYIKCIYIHTYTYVYVYEFVAVYDYIYSTSLHIHVPSCECMYMDVHVCVCVCMLGWADDSYLGRRMDECRSAPSTIREFRHQLGIGSQQLLHVRTPPQPKHRFAFKGGEADENMVHLPQVSLDIWNVSNSTVNVTRQCTYIYRPDARFQHLEMRNDAMPVFEPQFASPISPIQPN